MHGDDAERLAASVLLQAVNDAGLRSGTAEERRATHPCDRSEAVSFLTSGSGEWKRARDFWCGLANRDSDKLRRWAADKLGVPLEVPAPSLPQSSEPLRLFYPVPKPAKQHREARGPKMLMLQDMLRRPEGASPSEVMKQFGWARSTVMGALTSELRKYGVIGRRGTDGRYRLASLE